MPRIAAGSVVASLNPCGVSGSLLSGLLCERAGLGEGWHPHEQRHTFVSVLSHAGVDIEQIADAAGHINSNVTKTVYRHLLADKLSAAATVMDATFRVSGGAS